MTAAELIESLKQYNSDERVISSIYALEDILFEIGQLIHYKLINPLALQRYQSLNEEDKAKFHDALMDWIDYSDYYPSDGEDLQDTIRSCFYDYFSDSNFNRENNV